MSSSDEGASHLKPTALAGTTQKGSRSSVVYTVLEPQWISGRWYHGPQAQNAEPRSLNVSLPALFTVSYYSYDDFLNRWDDNLLLWWNVKAQ